MVLSDKQHSKSFLHSLIGPVSDFNRSWGNMKDLERDKLINYTKEWLNTPLDIITITLPSNKKQNISLNWHLIENEKEIIRNAINLPKNKEEINKLKEILN